MTRESPILNATIISELVARCLAEDVGRGDVTTDAVVDAGLYGRARIEAREACVVAGLEIARACFESLAPGRIGWTPGVRDGDRAGALDVLALLEGPMRALLTAERTALNLLQRASGVATLTHAFVEQVEATPARIVDTRKTTPGLRALEKYAVEVAGGHNHRFGLDDGVLIKDNHLAALDGDVSEAVRRARSNVPHGLLIEVEVSSLDQLVEALAAGADAVLLDNFTPDDVRRGVAIAGGKVLLEASGGIGLANVRDYALAGVDLISIGALTHSARAVDLALEVETRWS